MTLDRSYIGYLGFLGIDLFKSVLMYSNGAICLIKLLFKMGLFTVHQPLFLFIFYILFSHNTFNHSSIRRGSTLGFFTTQIASNFKIKLLKIHIYFKVTNLDEGFRNAQAFS
jgi:hypothetical protein